MKSSINKHQVFHQITQISITLLLSAIIGLTLLIIVYLLPVERIKVNLNDCTQIYLSESDQYELVPDYRSAILDNTTDTTMLAEAAFKTGSPLSDSLLCPRISIEGLDPIYSLLGYLNGDSENVNITTYSRYWHGYLIFLKPFLSLFDFADLRMFNLLLSLLGAFILLLSMWNNPLLKQYTPAMIAVFLFWNLGCLGLCLQYLSCYNIAVWFTILIIHTFPQVNSKSNHVFLLFCIIGVFTSYFDFLTYPIVTLGIPLSVYALLYFSPAHFNSATTCKNILHHILLCACWAVGYIGMWFEKWVIGSLLSNENVIKDGLQNVITRTGSVATVDSPLPSRFEAVLYIVRVSTFKWTYLILFITLLCFILVIKKRKQRSSTIATHNITLFMILLIIGFFPLFWYFIAANHSYIHIRLVCRALGVTIFAWASALLCI